MKRFQRLLVGIDLDDSGKEVSTGSRRAALQAQWLAERTSATLTFLHSTWADLYEESHQILPGPSPEGALAIKQLADEYEQSGTPVELVTTDGRPWFEMIRRVQRGENDLVFVGRRNEPGEILIGSTSRKLLRKCPAPVWVVKPEAELVHRNVLAATDLSTVGDLAVELGAYVAQAYECELHVVHAWQVPIDVQLEAARKSEEEHRAALDRIQRSAEVHIREALAAAEPGAEPRLHVGCDAPVHAILECVRRLEADLLVMGTLSRGGVAGLLMGNTAERLLDRADCSVLAIKPADFISPVQ